MEAGSGFEEQSWGEIGKVVISALEIAKTLSKTAS